MEGWSSGVVERWKKAFSTTPALHRSSTPPSWRIFLSLAFVAALSYLPGIRHGFVYDDHGAIVENAFLAEPANVLRVLKLEAFRDPQVVDGQRPVLLLTMFLDRAGSAAPQPWRHHTTNLFLHAMAVLLLFQLVRRLGGGIRIGAGVAATAALVLALHPAWSEAVQLPSYREDLLGLVFVLAYLLADFIARPVVRWPVQLLALALALGSKESAWAAPLLLGWMRICVPAQGRSLRALLAAVGVGLALVLATVLVGYAGRPMQAMGGSWNGISLRWPENLWTAPWIFWRYVALVAVPFPLVADRMVEAVPVAWSIRFLGSLAALLLLGWCAWRLRRTQPMLGLGAGWIVIAFGPISNLVPLFNPMAERYLYGLAPGFALLVAVTVVKMRRSWLLPVLCVGWIAVLQLRIGDWRDDATLWAVTAWQEPGSARAQVWLGLQAKQQGDRAAARVAFERARAANPQEVSALINLGVLCGEEGDLAEAERFFREAVRIRPEKREAQSNLALALELQGKTEDGKRKTEETENGRK